MAYRPRRLLSAAIPLLLVLTACGGDDPKPKAGDQLSATPSATSTPSASATSSAQASATASSSGRPGGAAGTSASASATASGPGGGGGGTTTSPRPGASGSATPRPLFLTLRLAKRCVVPGTEQAAAIRTEPGAEFVINTVYSDRKEGSVHGGLKHDKASSEGKYDYTWRVLPGTPPGEAITVVRVVKDGRRAQAIRRFKVSAIC